MPSVEFEGNTFNVDEDGFIDDFNNWNETWVKYVKHTEGIEELTDEHWKVINVLQDYYKKNGIAPMVRAPLSASSKCVRARITTLPRPVR